MADIIPYDYVDSGDLIHVYPRAVPILASTFRDCDSCYCLSSHFKYNCDIIHTVFITNEINMATSTLQIRIDSNLRKEADALFANTGLDLTSAVRLFLRQSVIRRRLPFEVVSENPDPFWSEANQRVLRESIASLERGEGQAHALIEV